MQQWQATTDSMGKLLPWLHAQCVFHELFRCLLSQACFPQSFSSGQGDGHCRGESILRGVPWMNHAIALCACVLGVAAYLVLPDFRPEAE